MALILSRRPGEKIMIGTPSGELVEMTVLGNSGPPVRMGFEANTNVTIDREEIYKKKKAEVSHG